MIVERVTEATPELAEAFRRLLPQLSERAVPPSPAELEELVRREDTHVLVAREEGRIVGSLTLVLYRIPTGLEAVVEDVVVTSPHEDAASARR